MNNRVIRDLIVCSILPKLFLFTDVDGFYESQIDSVGVARNDFGGYIEIAVVVLAGVQMFENGRGGLCKVLLNPVV